MVDDFTDRQDLKNKMNKQNQNELIHTENKLMVARWAGEGGGGGAG